jgi:hypothetical protein
MALHVADRNQECTVWVGGLEPQITEELLYELMLQAGPVVQLNMPRDPVTQVHQVHVSCCSRPLRSQFHNASGRRASGLCVRRVSFGNRCRVCHESHEHDSSGGQIDPSQQGSLRI